MKEYTVDIGGIEHTMRLSDEDAKRLGGKVAEKKERAKAPNKARTRPESK